MQNVFIINAHEQWPFSEGRLNRSMAERATVKLKNKGYEIQMTTMQDDYNVEKEIERHMWADALRDAGEILTYGCQMPNRSFPPPFSVILN